jgi:hypothetical protein
LNHLRPMISRRGPSPAGLAGVCARLGSLDPKLMPPGPPTGSAGTECAISSNPVFGPIARSLGAAGSI